MNTPYIGFGNDTLAKQPKVKKGDKVKCPHCEESHEIRFGKEDGKETDTLIFFKCGNDTYILPVSAVG